MLYAKIFTDYESEMKIPTSNKKPALASAHLLTPQSLFCFALGMDDSEDLLAKRRRGHRGEF